MRENRPYGSEGGVGESRSLPLSIHRDVRWAANETPPSGAERSELPTAPSAAAQDSPKWMYMH